MVSSKVFAALKTFPKNGEVLLNWASNRGIEVIDPSQASSTSALLDLLKEHQPFSLINCGGFGYSGGWSDELVEGLPSSVKAVCNFSAGYDSMGALQRFKAKNIQVSNTPKGVMQATADTGLYLILGALRNFNGLADSLHAKKFNKDVPLADEYDSKTLGIVGLGGIGALLRDKVVGSFDFHKIQYHNRKRAAPEVEKDSVYVTLDEILATSDVLVLVVPLTPETHHLINKDSLSKMKKGSIIVNIGRGPLIDEVALVDALDSGQLSSVGLDVFEHEPKINPRLLEHKASLLLPHVGTHTVVARTKMTHEVTENLDSLLKTGKVSTPVPELRD